MAYNYEEKLILHCLCQEKNSITRGLRKKDSYPNHQYPSPLSKVKWSAPQQEQSQPSLVAKSINTLDFVFKNCLKATHTERLQSRLRCTGVQILQSLKERRSVILSGPFNFPWSQHLSCHSLPYHPASYHDAINVVRLFKPL